MRKLLLSIILSSFLFSFVQSQENLALGQWRSHLPYRIGQFVAQSSSKIFYSTGLSILSLDKEELSVEFMSKVDGLSNVGVNIIDYNSPSDILIIIYDNSVIDLVTFAEDVPVSIVTMNQIQNFSNIVGEKLIYDIFIENDSVIYLAANYGISKVNIFANEFAFTTFTGVDVRSVQLFEGNIYAGTEEGIYRTNIDNINPEDFGNWQLLDEEEGFPLDYSTKAMVNYQGELYAGVNDTLFKLKEGALEFFHFEAGHSLIYLSAEGAHLLAGYKCTSGGCSRGKTLFFSPDGSFGSVADGCLGDPRNAIEDQQGRLWFGDRHRNFRMVENIDDAVCKHLSFNSPHSRQNRELSIYNNQVWIAAGGVNQTFSNRFLDHGFYSFIDGKWTVYNRQNREELRGEDRDPVNGRGDDLFDFITIIVHPQTEVLYAGSFYEGLIEFDGETMILYNEKNSSLGNAVGDLQRTRIGGLSFDEDNELWISNHSAESPISVLKNDGEWMSFAPSCNQTQIHQLDVDNNDFKWFVIESSQAGVMVFDEGVMDDPADDRCRVFTANNSNLPTNNTNCLVADLEGDVLVGTTEGVIIFECGGSAFEPECQGSRRIVEQDGFGAFLLETEEILSIAVDGANRKWIGTKNGIFVLSPNGEEQIARFTEDNSPLFDNNIIDIAINQDNGEVFIGTDKGVLSLKAEAIEGTTVNSSDIKIFPNPVRPDYLGPIAIRGLARDANVKITDINGKLVFEGQALGGQAIWDGRDYNGRRANSGVYLVFSTSSPRHSGFTAKPSAAVAKILLLN